MKKEEDQELHLNIGDLSPSGVKKIEAMFAHALGLDLSIEVTYTYPDPVLICYYKISDIKFNKEH